MSDSNWFPSTHSGFNDNYGNQTIKSFPMVANVVHFAQYETLHTS